jgi:hypothetical protein
MASIDETKTIPLYVTSSSRDISSASSSDCSIRLRKTLRRARRTTVASIEIPHSMYSIHNNNNIFSITYISLTNIHNIININLDTGCYTNPTTIASLLETQLNIDASDWLWTVTYSTTKCNFVIVADMNGVQITGDPSLLPTSLNKFLGFEFVTASVITGSVPNRVYTFTGTAFTLWPTHLVLTSTKLSNFIDTSYIVSTAKNIMIDVTNNTIWIAEWTNGFNDRNPGGTYTKITIPVGNYTPSSLALTLQFLFNWEWNTYTVIWDTLLFKFKVSLTFPTAGDSNGGTFTINSLTSTALTVLGWELFPDPVSDPGFNTENTRGETTFTGSQIDASIFNNYLAKIKLNTTIPGDIIIDVTNHRSENSYPTGFDVDDFDLQIRYPDETIVDLNGSNWSCTLLVDVNQ